MLYWDTDSAIFLERPGQYMPETGNFLGELTDELPRGRYIKKFYSGGPKNYSYVLDNGDSKCVIKGVSMNFSNSKIITPKTISSKIEKYVKYGDESRSLFYETDNFFKRSPDLHMYMVNHEKHYKILYDKRRYFKDSSTWPFGYKGIL